MTAVDERLAKPLRSGSRLAIIGLVLVLAAQALPPGPVSGWLANLLGTVVTTWGAVQATHWVAQLTGRRSLTETAIGLGITGTADAMAISAAQSSFDREHNWTLGIAALLLATLGLALVGSGAADFRKERKHIENPPPPPGPDAITEPQHPGHPLQGYQSKALRLTLIATAASFLVTLVVTFVR